VKLPKTVKKCIHNAEKLGRRFGPAVKAQAMDKCLRKSGSFGNAGRRRKTRRKHRR